ncbi:MAG TPA: GTP-binding protein, partial [Kaistia sp.]|nr:GTP-binding protein [Kaistia sp.]
LVDAEKLAAVERRIREINPHATIHRTERCAIDLSKVLDRGAFDLERILTLDPEFLEGDDHDHDHVHDENCGHDHHHHDHDHAHHGHDHDHDHHHHHPRHDESVFSVSLRGGTLDPNKFFPWIQEITQVEGPNILRLKGILAMDKDPDRYVLQGVHMIVEGTHQRPWAEGEKRESRLVFIGRKLNEQALRKSFEDCLVAA